MDAFDGLIFGLCKKSVNFLINRTGNENRAIAPPDEQEKSCGRDYARGRRRLARPYKIIATDFTS